MRLSPSRRAGISNGTVALVVVVIALFAFAYISLPQSTTSPNNTTAQGGAESVISLLGGYNSQTISSASVNMFTMQGGAYTKTIDSPGTVTSGTATSSTTNTHSPPWLTQCRGSAAWPLDVVTSGAGQSIAQDGTTVFTLTSGVPQGSSNNVPAY